MEKLNVVIVANNALIVSGLRNFLKARYGEMVNISKFYDTRTCLRNLKKNIQVIVTDCFLNGRDANECLKPAKQLSPGAEIILHSSKEEVAASIDKYCNQAKISLN